MHGSLSSHEDAATLPVVEEFFSEVTCWVRSGVHLPIPLLGTANEAESVGDPREITNVDTRIAAGVQPAYLSRDNDAELRALLSAATVASTPSQPNPPVRLVVVGGESGSGKTRTAVEAMRAELPDWRLLIPDGVAALRRYSTLPRTVVWLDEIWRLLGESGAVAEIERLLALTEGPTVLLATLSDGDRDGLRGGAWVLLDQRAQWTRLTRELTDAELAMAKELDDPWVSEAADRTEHGFGFAEWLAAGPLLQQRLDVARLSPDLVARAGAALVDGAVQCVRAGYDMPLPLPLLAEAHGLYYREPLPLERLDASEIPQLDDVIRWARQPVIGTVGLLRERPLRGDEVADYLVGYSQVSAEPIDARLWPILLRHITPATLLEIGLCAARQHDNHLVTRELARRADRMEDETYTAAELYAVLGDEAELRRCAAAGEMRAEELLAERLHDLGDEAELARLADEGDGWAAHMLARLRGEDNPRQAEFFRQAEARWSVWKERQARLLSDPEFAAEVTQRADAGDADACMELISLLLDQGDEAGLARRADAGIGAAAAALAELLSERGDEAGLARRANAGDYWARRWLADMLVESGDQAQLALRAAMRDEVAFKRLLDLFEERGDERELARLTQLGITEAAQPLAQLRAARTPVGE